MLHATFNPVIPIAMMTKHTIPGMFQLPGRKIHKATPPRKISRERPKQPHPMALSSPGGVPCCGWPEPLAGAAIYVSSG
jgi:hypothetical protein